MYERKSLHFRSRGPMAGVLFAIAGCLALLSPPLVLPGSWTDISINLLGWSAFVAGAGVRFWATLYIGGKKDRDLIRRGPYGLCRHPLYFGSFLVALGTVIFLKSVTLSVGFVFICIYYALIVIPAEEARLCRMFPGTYEQFKKEVPRLIPIRPKFPCDPSTQVTINLRGLWTECRRVFRWVWIPIIAQAICHLRLEPWWPHLFPFS